MKPKHLLVTGGAGFIGVHLVETLLGQGERVRVLDNFLTGKRENLESLEGRLDVVEGDIRDTETLRRVLDGVEVVFHQAALPSVPKSMANPLASHDHNATGTLALLHASGEAGVRRVVYASSSSVYGDSPTLPKHEGMGPDPRSPYAVSKLTGELYARVFSQSFGLETVGLRYFNIFGPRQDPDSPYAAVIPKFITAFLEGESPPVHGDGLQSRDFTYVDNAVQANLRAATASGVSGEAFNVGAGEQHTLLDLVTALQAIFGQSIPPQHMPPRPGDVRHSLADLTRAREKLGYEPAVTFREGLERTTAWFQARYVPQGR